MLILSIFINLKIKKRFSSEKNVNSMNKMSSNNKDQ